MKKKFMFIATLAAMLFASCAESADVSQPEKGGEPSIVGKTPVSFSVYADRGVTRGGKEGLMDLRALQETEGNGGGFGVFAYYTDLKKYDQTYVPNFMYNQGVFYNAGNWAYTPVVYWPNESGSDAQSDDEDKVSFFAYAPYVATTSAASGSVAEASSGITGFSRNSNAGDPLVKYIANFSTANTVDLCWGVCNEPNWAKIQNSGLQTMTAGLPWLDVEHPQTTAQKMKFTFKHALAQLNVQIDADADVASHSDGDALGAGTKIYVRSISFTGIALKGALNLNNTVANQALWLDYAGTTDLPYGESITVKDGRRDGREGTNGAEASNETPAGLNPAIIQNDADHPTTGVTTKYQNLFEPAVAAAIPGQPTNDEIAAALTNPVYVIPTGEAMTVTIVYDVETTSPNLSGYLSDGVTHGSSVENRITKTIYYNEAGLSLESGKKYTLKLHLGMNSVKFDAAVDSWDNTIINTNGWLPANTSAVRILQGGNQITHATMSVSDATLALTGDVHPSEAAQTLTWTSSNKAVATVADGTVTAVADGECTITATSTATGKTATVNLLVTHKYSDVVAGDVGKIIAANGYIYANTTKAYEYGTNGVGLICYAGAAGTADKSTGADSYKALALALTDANNGATCKWFPTNSGTCLAQQSDITKIYNTNYDTYLVGIDNTKTLTTDDGSGSGCDGHEHAAADAAKAYDVNVAGFTNSGWFLPSISQWNLMIKTLAPTTTDDYTYPDQSVSGWSATAAGTKDIPRWTWVNDGYKASTLNPLLTAVGATGLQSNDYWSSTEHSTYGAWGVRFRNGTVIDRYKSYSRCVRSVLAF